MERYPNLNSLSNNTQKQSPDAYQRYYPYISPDPDAYHPLSDQELARRKRLSRDANRTYFEARQSSDSLHAYMLLSEMALRLAANVKPDVRTRQERQHIMAQNRMVRLSGDFSRTPFWSTRSSL